MGYTTESLMLELMQPCNTLLKTCLWLGKRTKCNKLFRVVKSSVGHCCAFNYHAVKMQRYITNLHYNMFHNVHNYYIIYT